VTAGPACIPLNPDGTPDLTPVDQDYTASVTMGADGGAKPGEVWMLSITCGGRIRHSGTITPGATKEANWTILDATPGVTFGGEARAFLPFTGLIATAVDDASVRGTCGLAPIILGFTCTAPDGIGGPEEQPDGGTFERFSNDTVAEWSIAVLFSAAPTGLEIEWGGDISGVTSGISWPNSNIAENKSFTVTITNAHGMDAGAIDLVINNP
jgi:hypothetical protein